MSASEKKAIAKAQVGGAVASYDYGDDAGAGFEGMTGADLSVPFLGVLQSNSAQVESQDPPGSTAGMFYNTVTRELHDGDEGVILIPCYKEMAYVEWVPIDDGGGFVGIHASDSAEVKRAIENNNGERIGKLEIGDGHELVETHYLYALTLDPTGEETIGFVVISFTSTKIKTYRDLMTAMYTLKGRPPMFANRLRLRTVKEKNKKGTFFNFRAEPLKPTWTESLIDPTKSPHLLEEARKFREMVVSGAARATFETERSTGDGATDNSPDEPPF